MPHTENNKYRKFLWNESTDRKAENYLHDLKNAKVKPGDYLAKIINKRVTSDLNPNILINLLIQTKKQQIFAESEVFGDGRDWNLAELSILGDISCSVPVTIYDDGKHHNPVIHEKPFKGVLIYVPGALFRNDNGLMPVDYDEIVENGKIDQERYYQLYERRLLPVFNYIQETAALHNKEAIVTIPGIGCGQFAGKFKGQMGEMLKNVLLRILQEHGSIFSNIKMIYYDPYGECDNETHTINDLSFRVRPFKKGNHKPQLCNPEAYEEDNDNFSNSLLFSLVAWDHVSWPGNDFYIGHRVTDDGVKAAATNSMTVLTGINGAYNRYSNTYNPLGKFSNWTNAVNFYKINLDFKFNKL